MLFPRVLIDDGDNGNFGGGDNVYGVSVDEGLEVSSQTTADPSTSLALLRNSWVSLTHAPEPMSVKVTSIYLGNLSCSVAS